MAELWTESFDMREPKHFVHLDHYLLGDHSLFLALGIEASLQMWVKRLRREGLLCDSFTWLVLSELIQEF